MSDEGPRVTHSVDFSRGFATASKKILFRLEEQIQMFKLRILKLVGVYIREEEEREVEQLSRGRLDSKSEVTDDIADEISVLLRHTFAEFSLRYKKWEAILAEGDEARSKIIELQQNLEDLRFNLRSLENRREVDKARIQGLRGKLRLRSDAMHELRKQYFEEIFHLRELIFRKEEVGEMISSADVMQFLDYSIGFDERTTRIRKKKYLLRQKSGKEALLEDPGVLEDNEEWDEQDDSFSSVGDSTGSRFGSSRKTDGKRGHRVVMANDMKQIDPRFLAKLRLQLEREIRSGMRDGEERIGEDENEDTMLPTAGGQQRRGSLSQPALIEKLENEMSSLRSEMEHSKAERKSIEEKWQLKVRHVLEQKESLERNIDELYEKLEEKDDEIERLKSVQDLSTQKEDREEEGEEEGEEALTLHYESQTSWRREEARSIKDVSIQTDEFGTIPVKYSHPQSHEARVSETTDFVVSHPGPITMTSVPSSQFPHSASKKDQQVRCDIPLSEQERKVGRASIGSEEYGPAKTWEDMEGTSIDMPSHGTLHRASFSGRASVDSEEGMERENADPISVDGKEKIGVKKEKVPSRTVKYDILEAECRKLRRELEREKGEKDMLASELMRMNRLMGQASGSHYRDKDVQSVLRHLGRVNQTAQDLLTLEESEEELEPGAIPPIKASVFEKLFNQSQYLMDEIEHRIAPVRNARRESIEKSLEALALLEFTDVEARSPPRGETPARSSGEIQVPTSSGKKVELHDVDKLKNAKEEKNLFSVMDFARMTFADDDDGDSDDGGRRANGGMGKNTHSIFTLSVPQKHHGGAEHRLSQFPTLKLKVPPARHILKSFKDKEREKDVLRGVPAIGRRVRSFEQGMLNIRPKFSETYRSKSPDSLGASPFHGSPFRGSPTSVKQKSPKSQEISHPSVGHSKDGFPRIQPRVFGTSAQSRPHSTGM
eukprot:TRINITY_DN571_c0_g1_i2.p1 TRINITY_DN571_c0_g1~~TRINITY_DN571_c0_g1_i2.p1  ORF type:complete len:945 (+),score=295.47 TRINITY_DN571_c0_g1_i2:113-2947(+)